MANKFKVWIDSSNNNILSEQEYAEDTQRTNGFTTGTVASSKRVNSALRSSTLVTAALMGLVDNSSLDLTSSLSDVQAAISNYLTNLATVTEDQTVENNVVKFTIGNSTYNKTINNVSKARTADDYNTSSGGIKSKFDDIDQRLNALGFREDDILNSDGGVVGHIKRQGYYVIGYINSTWTALQTVHIPEDYRPILDQSFGCRSQIEILVSSTGVSGSGSNQGGMTTVLTIKGTQGLGDAGLVSLSQTAVSVRPSTGLQASAITGFISCQFGYDMHESGSTI